jgi:hypothetical protein
MESDTAIAMRSAAMPAATPYRTSLRLLGAAATFLPSI